mmetsp:Transcript_31078/g.84279  ORF Transcript_31078/g.84279 Transcript_31078/m.84279 type:complete len:383 (+) Transcript_31078:98-1246(+)
MRARTEKAPVPRQVNIQTCCLSYHGVAKHCTGMARPPRPPPSRAGTASRTPHLRWSPSPSEWPSVVPDGPVHVVLADRAVGAATEPLVDAAGVEDMAARKPTTLVRDCKVGEAYHACLLRQRASRSIRWRPREPFYLAEGILEEPPSLCQHVLEFTGGPLGVQEQHLQPRRQLCNLAQQLRWQQVSQGGVQDALAEDRCVLANASRLARLTRHHLKLDTVIHEEVVARELLVRVYLKKWLEVVLECVELVRSRDCVLEGHDVDFLELRRLVPVGEDLRLVRDDTEAGGLRSLDLQVDVTDLEDLVAVEQAHSLCPCRPIRCILTFEVLDEALREERVRRHLVGPPCAELDLLEADHWAALYVVVRVDTQRPFGRFTLDDGKL